MKKTGTKPSVRRGRAAKVSQVHESKRRYRRTDILEGVTYGDWYDQNLAAMGADQSKHQVNPRGDKV